MEQSLKDGLIWDIKAGYGFHPMPAMTYEGSYFSKYQAMDMTDMGWSLTDARIKLVDKYYWGESLIDIGIGGGLFVSTIGCKGYDVCNQAVDWLKARNDYRDPYVCYPEAITCWDSLEHIPEPQELINRATRFVFVSMPIYKDRDDCINSKHFKPGEHLHYWTHNGLLDWFARLGFICLEHNQIESDLGREGISSYVFKRF
jgi:hypothetical protein